MRIHRLLARAPVLFTGRRATAALSRVPITCCNHKAMQQEEGGGRGVSTAAGGSPDTGGAAAGAGIAAAAAVDIPAAATPPPKPRQISNFCRQCGGHIELVLAEGGTRWRHVCQNCSFTDYYNPKLVVGAIVEHEGKVLLCRRGIEPQRGLWTVPAGFMELDESTAEGAARETLEEAGAHVEITSPFCHWDIPVIGQVYMLFRARLAAPYTFAAQLPESLEAQLFEPEQLPWDELAFSSVSLALNFWLEDRASGKAHLHHGVISKKAGAGPNDKGGFELTQHWRIPTLLSP